MTSAISGRPARCLANRFTALGEAVEPGAIPDYPIAYDAGKALHAAAKAAGEFGYGAQWAGQGAPLARSLPAAMLVAELRSEMEQAPAPAKCIAVVKLSEQLPTDSGGQLPARRRNAR